jgi:hypothetical protein
MHRPKSIGRPARALVQRVLKACLGDRPISPRWTADTAADPPRRGDDAIAAASTAGDPLGGLTGPPGGRLPIVAGDEADAMCEVLYDRIGRWATHLADADDRSESSPKAGVAAAGDLRLLRDIGPDAAWDRPAALRMPHGELAQALLRLRSDAAEALFAAAEEGSPEGGRRHDRFLLAIRACTRVLAELGYGDDEPRPLGPGLIDAAHKPQEKARA